MEKYLKPIIPVLVFVFFQSVGFIGVLAYLLIRYADVRQAIMKGDVMSPLLQEYQTPTVLGVYLIVTGILTVCVLLMIKMAKSSTAFDTKSIDWKWAAIAVLAAVCGIFATDILSEWLALPNLLEQQFTDLSSDVFGVLAVAIVGPVVEEIVFRESIIGPMIRDGFKPWTAILVSSCLFGLIHLNPAQVPFAMIVGIILGVIYVKTGNVIVTSIVHIINNGTSVALMAIYGQEANDMTISDGIGVASIPLMLLLAAVSICLLCRFWKGYPSAAQIAGSGSSPLG